MSNLIEEELRKEFNCVRCSTLLAPPIMLIATIGNVCSSCYSKEFTEKNKVTKRESHNLVAIDENNIQPAIQNIALEGIMQSIRSSCLYNERGCPFVSNLTELPSHELLCDYRKIDCVLKECKWSGTKNRYIDHLLQPEHDSSVSFSQPGDPTIFPLNHVSFIRESEGIRILKTISGICLFYFKSYSYGINSAICRIETESEEESIDIEVLLKNENNENITYSYKCCFIDQIEMLKNFCEHKESEIKCNILILSAMERSKNFSVRLKHNIMGQLIRGIRSQETKILIRQEVAKKLKDSVRFECDNVDNGCYISPLVQDEHSLSCKYQFWNCSCDIYFGIVDAEDHFRNTHKYVIDKPQPQPNQLNSYCGKLLQEGVYKNYISAFNYIFTLKSVCRMSRSVEFCVQKLGIGSNEKFCYEIIMSNKLTTFLIKVPLSPSEPTKFSVDFDLLIRLFGSLENMNVIEKITPI